MMMGGRCSVICFSGARSACSSRLTGPIRFPDANAFDLTDSAITEYLSQKQLIFQTRKKG